PHRDPGGRAREHARTGPARATHRTASRKHRLPPGARGRTRADGAGRGRRAAQVPRRAREPAPPGPLPYRPGRRLLPPGRRPQGERAELRADPRARRRTARSEGSRRLPGVGCMPGVGDKEVTMRAAVMEGIRQPLVVRDVPDPTPPENGVVVRVEANGICRTDWHLWMGDWSWI